MLSLPVFLRPVEPLVDAFGGVQPHTNSYDSDRSSTSDDSQCYNTLRHCTQCGKEISGGAAVHMALDKPFCAHDCRQRFVLRANDSAVARKRER